MNEWAVGACFIAVGMVKAYPAIVVVQPGQLARLYRLDPGRPDLVALLRHRGLMLGLIGGFLIVAGLVPSWRLPAAGMGLISMAGFAILVATSAQSNPALHSVARIDVVLAAILVGALIVERLA